MHVSLEITGSIPEDHINRAAKTIIRESVVLGSDIMGILSFGSKTAHSTDVSRGGTECIPLY